MNTKVLINARAGSIEVEGEIDFVKEVYADFKELIFKAMKEAAELKHPESSDGQEDSYIAPKNKKRSVARKTVNSENNSSGVNPDNPTLDKNLDTSGLREFYAPYAPKNHSEKILIFMRFLKDKKEIESPNTDQIYTCYNAVGEKPAAAFAQSFRDTSSKKFGFIDYNSASNIGLTFIGNRHFDHDLKKKGTE